MEAVWTLYLPLSIYIRSIITSGILGPVHRVSSDLSLLSPLETQFPDDKSLIVNPDLAGGALLDIGIYALLWCFQTLYLTQDPATRKPPKVLATALNHYRTGVDEQTTVLLNFPRETSAGGDAHAIATTSLRIESDPLANGSAGPAVRVQGAKGEIQVFHPSFRPTKTKLILADGTVEEKDWPQPGPGEGSGWFNGEGRHKNKEGEGHGMFWEADDAALGMVEGRKEGSVWKLEESVLVMEVMDEVRRQGGMKFPEKVESMQYPLELDSRK